MKYGPDYLSPTSINQYLDDIEEFFLRYIVRVPRSPQTQPMAIGSAFDACIKAFLVTHYSEDGYDKERHGTLYQEFLQQEVEEQHREWAYTQGIIIYNMYKSVGALDNLLNDVEPGSLETLDKLLRVVTINGLDVPLLGKPDLLWISKAHGCKIVDDWKCNGACSPHNKSPHPGYVDIFPSRNIHKDCLLVNGVNVLDMHQDYSLQLTVYKILTGAEIVGINQLVFGKAPVGTIGDLRVALHRHRVSPEREKQVLDAAHQVWSNISNYERGGPFSSISAERCELLWKQGELFKDPVERLLSGR